MREDGWGEGVASEGVAGSLCSEMILNTISFFVVHIMLPPWKILHTGKGFWSVTLSEKRFSQT